jgi:hypothetical protein
MLLQWLCTRHDCTKPDSESCSYQSSLFGRKQNDGEILRQTMNHSPPIYALRWIKPFVVTVSKIHPLPVSSHQQLDDCSARLISSLRPPQPVPNMTNSLYPRVIWMHNAITKIPSRLWDIRHNQDNASETYLYTYLPIYIYIYVCVCVCVSKAINTTGRGGLWGWERPRIPHCLASRLRDGCEIIRLTRLPRSTAPKHF